MRWLILIPLLVGCTGSELQQIQNSLTNYAKLSARLAPLDSVLGGAALASAQQSYQLIESLQLTQQGLASFEVETAEQGRARGCLDVGEVKFRNQKGELIAPDRPARSIFSATYDSSFLITELRVSEEPC
ncbi:MAG: hypothetical protein F2536_04790 [Actinobacteria bacterium]|uniref:Unannotated protein n=1 Tax=freshwater metagenome TaxID=449393 RepID=A0A6J6EE08_9ZZZZ|nr:hypothetical protein [Actinomycetota bacterium]MTA90211.1 hypothetical protein [Actinomycetota bacterium]